MDLLTQVIYFGIVAGIISLVAAFLLDVFTMPCIILFINLLG